MIDLSLLPAPITLKKSRSWLFWFVILILFIVIGFVIVVILQLNKYLELRHILVGVVVSVLSWAIVLCFSLYIRGCEEFYAEGWSYTREQKREQLISFGQRPLHAISCQLSSELGHTNHAISVAEGLISPNAKLPDLQIIGATPIIYSRFPFDELKPNDFHKKIEILFGNLQPTLTILNNNVFSTKQKHIRLFIDAPIPAEYIKQIWENKFGGITKFNSWEIIDVIKSTVFLDSWLDDYSNDDKLLCCISLHLFDLPNSFSTEAMTSIIFLGNNLIDEKPIIEFIQENKLQTAALHRTEEGDNLEHVLKHAELWGAYDSDEDQLKRIWLNQLPLESNIALSKYIENGLSIDNISQIDSAFGIAGNCDYWVAIALAIEYAAETKGKQLIVGKNIQRFNATIVDLLLV